MAVIGLVMATAVAGGCRSDAPAADARPAAAAGIEWRPIGSWSGGGNRQTESFDVSLSAMRLRWQTTRETSPGAGRLVVTLHSAVSGRPLQTIVDAHGVTSATVNVAEEPRLCHFVIEGTNVEWQMTLEQGYAIEPH